MSDKITSLCQSVEKEVVQWRRHLHEHPELGFQEFKTSRFIENKLNSFGGVQVSRPTPTGVVGVLKGKKPGKTVAFRADIDALPINESEENNPRSLVKGVMHACGHDGHTATLLGVAKVLSQIRNEVEGEIRFIFQPAEEVPPGGAASMVAAGVMDGVDYIFGMHYDVQSEPGVFWLKPGVMFASTYTFDIKISGIGTHAAFPFKGTDTILIASKLIVALNSIIPRSIDNSQRAILTITQINGGNSYNTIPESVILAGTIRILDHRTEETLLERVQTISNGICQMYSTQCELVFHKGYNVVENDPLATKAVRTVLEGRFGKENVQVPIPLMGGEDFSAFLKMAPGCYYRVGALKHKHNNLVYSTHQSQHEINDNAIVFGMEAGVRVLLFAPRLIAETRLDH